MRIVAALGALLILLTACSSPQADANPYPQARASAWGAVWAVGRAPTLDAPALYADSTQMLLAWPDVAANRIMAQRRGATGAQVQDERILAQGVTDARALTLHRLSDEVSIVLWLAQDAQAQTRVFALVTDDTLNVVQGAVPISDADALDYAAVAEGTEGLWAVWAGGLPDEPSLHVQSIDALGRAQVPALLHTNARHPAFARDSQGRVWLFWIRASDGVPHRARFESGTLTQITALAQAAPLASTDQLVGMRAGFDSTHGYLFWHIIDAQGIARTLYTSGIPDSLPWPAPQALTLQAVSDMAAPQVGFNSGAVSAAAPAGDAAVWVAPLDAASEYLPAAAWLKDAWGVVYFNGGVPVALQPIAAPVSPALGLPALFADRERHLTLAWASPRDEAALLEITTTRR